MNSKDELAGAGGPPEPDEMIDHSEHLTDAQISSFLSRTLTDDSYEEVASHFASCRQCRDHVAEVNRLVQSYSRDDDKQAKGWRVPRAPLVLLAASVAIVAFLGGRTLLEEGQTRERADDPELVPPISAVGPVGTVGSDIDELNFRWRSVATDTYRLTLLDEAGTQVVAVETTDTTAIIKTEVLPGRGRRYFWRVDAIADEVVATSPLYVVELR